MDSKKFGGNRLKAHMRRMDLAIQIEELCTVRTVLVTSDLIDKNLTKRVPNARSLNRIEIAMAEEVIQDMHRCCNVTEVLLDGELFNPLVRRYNHLRAESKADATDVIVSAASICAKSVRDELLISTFGMECFLSGSGYPNKKTEAWLREYVEEKGSLPDGLRRSWSWCKKVKLFEMESQQGSS